jgi:hypothetical protein
MTEKITVKFETTKEKLLNLFSVFCPHVFVEPELKCDYRSDGSKCYECTATFIDRITVDPPEED